MDIPYPSLSRYTPPPTSDLKPPTRNAPLIRVPATTAEGISAYTELRHPDTADPTGTTYPTDLADAVNSGKLLNLMWGVAD